MLRGRSIETVFKQSLRCFLSDYLKVQDLSQNIPFHILNCFFKIKLDFKTMKIVYKEYRKRINQKFYMIPDYFLYSLKDIKCLIKIYPENVCRVIFSLLYKYYYTVPTKFRKECSLGAILYLYNKDFINKPIPQHFFAELFETTEVTLRNRIKNLSKIKKLSLHLSPFFNELIKWKTNDELIEENDSAFGQIFNQLSTHIKNRNFLEINKTIKTINISSTKAFLKIKPKFIPLLQLDDGNVVKNIINCLISNNCNDDELSEYIAKYLGSEDDSLFQDVLKFIYYFRPDLKNQDIYSILDKFSNALCLRILMYIEEKEERISKRKFMKNYIELKIYEDAEES